MSKSTGRVRRSGLHHKGDYYLGHYWTQATRDIHGKPNTWPVYDNRTDPQWYDDNVAEFEYLADAKQYMINNSEV